VTGANSIAALRAYNGRSRVRLGATTKAVDLACPVEVAFEGVGGAGLYPGDKGS
jgi:hypothetical protein